MNALAVLFILGSIRTVSGRISISIMHIIWQNAKLVSAVRPRRCLAYKPRLNAHMVRLNRTSPVHVCYRRVRGRTPTTSTELT